MQYRIMVRAAQSEWKDTHVIAASSRHVLWLQNYIRGRNPTCAVRAVPITEVDRQMAGHDLFEGATPHA